MVLKSPEVGDRVGEQEAVAVLAILKTADLWHSRV